MKDGRLHQHLLGARLESRKGGKREREIGVRRKREERKEGKKRTCQLDIFIILRIIHCSRERRGNEADVHPYMMYYVRAKGQ